MTFLHNIAELFAANPLAQSVGLIAFGIGISAFVQKKTTIGYVLF